MRGALKRNPALYSILIVNVVVFVVAAIIEPDLWLGLDRDSGSTYYELGGISPLTEDSWRFFTATVMHANVFHLLANMLAFASAGIRTLEELVGWVTFFSVYLVAGVAGAVFSCTRPLTQIASDGIVWPAAVSVGASGSIFGVYLLIITMGYRVTGFTNKQLNVTTAIFVGLNLVINIAVPAIDWRAHLGGALVGAVAGLFIRTNQLRQHVQ